MKFKHNDRIIKNNNILNNVSYVNEYDKIYGTIYQIEISSTSGLFYTFKGDITKTTYPSDIIDFEFDKYDEALDRKFKILNLIKKINQ